MLLISSIYTLYLLIVFEQVFTVSLELRSQTIDEFFHNGGQLKVLMFYGRKRFVRLMIPQLKSFRRVGNSSRLMNRQAVVSQVVFAMNTKVEEDVSYLEKEVIDNDYFVKLPLDDIGDTVY